MPMQPAPDETFEKILDISRELFAEKSFEDVSLEDILGKLDEDARKEFYKHFTSKREVLNALFDRTYTGQNNGLDNIMISADYNGKERLQAVIKNDLERNLSSENNKAMIKVYSGLMKSPSFFAEKFAIDMQTVKIIESLIDEGMEDGSFGQGCPKLMAEVCMMFVNFWMFPKLYPASSANEISQKVDMIAKMTTAIGMDIVDDELKDLYVKIFEAAR